MCVWLSLKVHVWESKCKILVRLIRFNHHNLVYELVRAHAAFSFTTTSSICTSVLILQGLVTAGSTFQTRILGESAVILVPKYLSSACVSRLNWGLFRYALGKWFQSHWDKSEKLQTCACKGSASVSSHDKYTGEFGSLLQRYCHHSWLQKHLCCYQ